MLHWTSRLDKLCDRCQSSILRKLGIFGFSGKFALKSDERLGDSTCRLHFTLKLQTDEHVAISLLECNNLQIGTVAPRNTLFTNSMFAVLPWDSTTISREF
jgi:hypothetical protein